MIYGITLNRLVNQPSHGIVMNALAHLPVRSTIRYVCHSTKKQLSPHQYKEVYYFSQAANVWGSPNIDPTLDTYCHMRDFRRAVNHLPIIKTWEVGHSPNVEGGPRCAAKKILTATAALKEAGVGSWLTLYWHAERHRQGVHTTWRWVEKFIPMSMRDQFDYVGVAFDSYKTGFPIDFQEAICCLADLFPGKLLISETAADGMSARQQMEVLRDTHSSVPIHPRFHGGWFWKHFNWRNSRVNTSGYNAYHKLFLRLFEKTANYAPTKPEAQAMWVSDKSPSGLHVI